ncbi:MAG: C25 family cysteine peptidase [bacterium]
MRKFVFFMLALLVMTNAQEIGAKYLIITHDNFVNDIQPLAEWKHKKGMRTKVVTLSQIGSSSSQIKSYIQTAYNTWQIPPEFVLLVGAPNLLPWGQSYSDNYYMDVAGDLLNDILAGRLTVHNNTEAQTVVNKILLYERNPHMTDSLWMTNACLIVREDNDPYDDSIYWSDAKYARSLMRANEYNTIDTLSRLAGNNTNDVIQSVNDGRAFVMFRGQGVGNWWSPFDVNPDLTANGERLPVVLSITCRTIGTGSTPAIAEKWLLTGTPTNPRGASAYFATTTVISGSAYLRSATAKGFFTGLFVDKKRTFGEACETGRRNVYNLYGNTSEYRGFATLGDPEMNIWTGTPRPINVAHVPSLAATDDSLLVTVTLYGTGIDSALVCIVLDTMLYEYGYTDGDGEIVFPLSNLHPGQIDVTVTGRNLMPYEALINIVDDNPYLEYCGHTIEDSLGNNNGIPESGETILLYALIRNIGLAPASNVAATLRSDDPFISIIDSSSYYGYIPTNDSASNVSPYVLTVSPLCPDGHGVDLEISISDSANNTWLSSFAITISNPSLGSGTGPDTYGYYMYDDTDTLTGYAPTFDWYSGTMFLVDSITDEDADTVTYSLPFNFPFYGLSYNAIGLCSNGFMEMGESSYRFGANEPIPSSSGPRQLIAPFWDDLDPRPAPTGTGDIYYAHDATNNRWIVEFRSVGHIDNTNQRETFQMQLLDPQYHPTPTGDGEILFLYDTVTDASSNTVGIEDHTQTRGLQYAYNGSYHQSAAPLANGRAILVTTKAPAGIWLYTTYYTFDDSVGGNNNGQIEPGETIDIYATVENGGNAIAYNVTGTLQTDDPDANIIQSTALFGDIATGSSASNYGTPFIAQISSTPSDTTIGLVLHLDGNNGAYQKSDYFTFYIYGSPGVEEQKSNAFRTISLAVNPNPFKQITDIRYLIPVMVNGKPILKIYDVSGRLVKDFSDKLSVIGYPSSVMWDGTDEHGRRVAGGVYFVNLNVAGSLQKTKVILLK